MRSSFPGAIEEIPAIFVDNFTDQTKNAYFLSHFHGDHIVGLKDGYLPKALKRNNSYIYASEETVAIVNVCVPQLRIHLKVLQLGRNEISIIKDGEQETFDVIALEAKHIWGSLMFLFQYKGQNIMFTGDFRISPNELNTSSYEHLFNNHGKKVHLDKLYIDATFEGKPSLPHRSVVEMRVVELVRKWLEANKENKVVFLTSACFGYEGVCNTVYNKIGVKTYIVNNNFNKREDVEIWDIYSQFPTQFPGITNDPETRIELYENSRKEEKYEDISALLSAQNILTIHFRAMFCINNDDHINKIGDNYYEALYATHCAHDEFHNFIEKFDVNPDKIVKFTDPV